MPRCKACIHPMLPEINRALAAQEPERTVANRFGLSKASVHRHKKACVPSRLAAVQERLSAAERREIEARGARSGASAVDEYVTLQRCWEKMDLMLDACDRFLTDPADASRYDLGPRADDVEVVFVDGTADPKLRKARLSELLRKVEEGLGMTTVGSRWKIADPRKLIHSTVREIRGNIALLQDVRNMVPKDKALEMIGAVESAVMRNLELYATEDVAAKVLNGISADIRGKVPARSS